MQSLLAVLYIVLSILPFSVLRYLPFVHQLRMKMWAVCLSFMGILCVECVLYLDAVPLGIDGERFRLLFYLLYLLLSCAAIAGHPAKHLLVWVLCMLFSSLMTAIAMLVESRAHSTIPFLVFDLTLIAILPLYLWGGVRFLRRVIVPLLKETDVQDCALFDLLLALAFLMGVLSTGEIRGQQGMPLVQLLVRCCGAGIGILACLIFRRVTQKHRRILALQQEKAEREQLLAMDREQYQSLSLSIESARLARHDLRHHLAAIGLYCAQNDLDGLKQYLAQLNAAIPPESIPRYCEDALLNGIFAHYQELARKDGIAMEICIVLARPLELTDCELWVLLGNLLENAVEGVRTMPDGRRWIRARIQQQGHLLGVVVDNPCAIDALCPENGWFLSTKSAVNSGMGLKSVLYLAQAHGGSATFAVENGCFQASVNLRA